MFFEVLIFQLGMGISIPQSNDTTMELVNNNPEVYMSVQFDPESSIIIPELEPFYVWGSYNHEQDLNLLGQRLGKNDQISFGLGYENQIVKKTKWFVEFGYTLNNLSTSEIIQDEVNFTYLVGRHNVHESRPIPVTVNSDYDQDSYETSTRLNNNWMGRIGIRHNVSDNFGLELAYKYQQLPIKYELYDAQLRAAGRGYWEEHNHIDGSSVSFSVFLEF